MASVTAPIPVSWDQQLQRLWRPTAEASRDSRPQEHLFLGTRKVGEAEEPILIHRDALREHGYILGRSGSGKTSMGIMPLVIQLLRSDVAGHGFGPPVIVLDLKGDMALFNTVRLEAEARRIRAKVPHDDPRGAFKLFTVRRNRQTDLFDPFQNLQELHDSPMELGEILIQCLSLFHGDEYGAGYYSRQHRDLLIWALEELRHDNLPRLSWEDILARIEPISGQRRHKDTQELVSCVRSVSRFKQLRTTRPANDPGVIHFRTALENSQVVYFWLHSRTVPMSARDIGKMALFALLQAAGDLSDDGKAIQTYVFIDEFQRIAARNIAQILQDARSYGLSLILAHQNSYDLRLRDIDLRPTVLGNTRLKLFFSSMTPDELEWLEKVSGEKLSLLRSWTEARSVQTAPIAEHASETSATTEAWRPYLEKNEIIEASNNLHRAIVHIAGDHGLTRLGGRPTVIRTEFPMAAAEYAMRLATPWPKASTIKTPSDGIIQPPPVDGPSLDQLRQKRRDALSDYAAYLFRRERGEDVAPPSISVTEI